MKTNMSYRYAVAGLAALTLMVGVSCGKKGSSGVATAPATQDCTSGTSCTVGTKYASGVFITSATGQNSYGSNKNILAKLGFFGTDASGVHKDNGTVTYNGAIVTTGSLKVATGSYGALTKPMTERAVSSVSWSIDLGLLFGGGGNNNYNNGGNYNYNDPGYSNSYGNDYTSYYPTNPGGYSNSCNCNYDNGNGGYDNGNNGSSTECELPVGTFTLTTTTAGQWSSDYYSSPAFTNITVKISGTNVKAEGIFTDGYVQSGNNNSSGNTLYGQLVITKLNGKTCNSQVTF